MLVKCGGTSLSEMAGSLMSARSRTTESNTVTGLGRSDTISPAGRGLANEYISMNCRKSPGYSRSTRACSASAIRFTFTYRPP